MKIAFIAVKGIPYGGGIEKVTEEIGKRLVERGHEVVVYCSNAYTSSDGDYAGMTLRVMPSLKNHLLQKVTLCLVATLHVILLQRPDVIHFHSIGSLFSVFPRVLGLRCIAHIHSFEWQKAKWSSFVRSCLKLSDVIANHCVDHVVVASETLLSYWKARHTDSVSVIPSGVDDYEHIQPLLIRDYGLTNGDFILYMGRLSSEKGVHYLVDAYSGSINNMKLVLAGAFSYDSAYNNSLRQKCARNKNIILMGYVEGRLKAELLSNAYMFVLPSEIEGSSVALVEAMAYGNCCIVSDIAENLNTLAGYGYSFKKGDSADLAALLSFLLSRKDEVEKHKSGAKEHVLRNNNWDEITNKIENIYLSLARR